MSYTLFQMGKKEIAIEMITKLVNEYRNLKVYELAECLYLFSTMISDKNMQEKLKNEANIIMQQISSWEIFKKQIFLIDYTL